MLTMNTINSVDGAACSLFVMSQGEERWEGKE